MHYLPYGGLWNVMYVMATDLCITYGSSPCGWNAKHTHTTQKRKKRKKVYLVRFYTSNRSNKHKIGRIKPGKHSQNLIQRLWCVLKRNRPRVVEPSDVGD